MSIPIAKQRARQARTATGIEEKLNYLADAIFQMSESVGQIEQQLQVTHGKGPAVAPSGLVPKSAGSDNSPGGHARRNFVRTVLPDKA